MNYLKKEYVGKEISYFLNDLEIKAVINSKTRNNFFIRTHKGKYYENNNEYNVKLNLVYTKNYLKILNNLKYVSTKSDYKSYKNRNHNIKIRWIYFSKKIYVNEELYEVVVDIQNKDKKYIIYNLKIKEVSSLTSY